jgi:hypothetical protein
MHVPVESVTYKRCITKLFHYFFRTIYDRYRPETFERPGQANNLAFLKTDNRIIPFSDLHFGFEYGP